MIVLTLDVAMQGKCRDKCLSCMLVHLGYFEGSFLTKDRKELVIYIQLIWVLMCIVHRVFWMGVLSYWGGVQVFMSAIGAITVC